MILGLNFGGLIKTIVRDGKLKTSKEASLLKVGGLEPPTLKRTLDPQTLSHTWMGLSKFNWSSEAHGRSGFPAHSSHLALV